MHDQDATAKLGSFLFKSCLQKTGLDFIKGLFPCVDGHKKSIGVVPILPLRAEKVTVSLKSDFGGVIVVACVIAFVLAKGTDVSPALMEKNDITEGTSKLIGAACILVYILVIAAAVSIIYSECSKALKKK